MDRWCKWETTTDGENRSVLSLSLSLFLCGVFSLILQSKEKIRRRTICCFNRRQSDLLDSWSTRNNNAIEAMFAPRAVFQLIYVLSPIKVASVFLTSFHCLFLLIALLTSFWIETKTGHYGPLFRCEKDAREWTSPNLIECRFGGFSDDHYFFAIPRTAFVILLSLFLAFTSMIIATLSFQQNGYSTRDRCWSCHILLLFGVCLLDCFLLISVRLRYRNEAHHLQWAYGLHCGATLFAAGAFIMAALMHRTDDIQYIEGIDLSPGKA